jgi:hypothetical protein
MRRCQNDVNLDGGNWKSTHRPFDLHGARDSLQHSDFSRSSFSSGDNGSSAGDSGSG